MNRKKIKPQTLIVIGLVIAICWYYVPESDPDPTTTKQEDPVEYQSDDTTILGYNQFERQSADMKQTLVTGLMKDRRIKYFLFSKSNKDTCMQFLEGIAVANPSRSKIPTNGLPLGNNISYIGLEDKEKGLTIFLFGAGSEAAMVTFEGEPPLPTKGCRNLLTSDTLYKVENTQSGHNTEDSAVGE